MSFPSVHDTRDVLFRLCANTDPQRDSIFTKGPADLLDHATRKTTVGSKLGIDATISPSAGPRRRLQTARERLSRWTNGEKGRVEKLHCGPNRS